MNVKDQNLKERQDESTPSKLLELAIAKDMDITKLEKLMQMKNDWDNRNARLEFFEALSSFQSEVPPLEKSKEVKFEGRTGGKTSYKFAPLGEIERHIKPHMEKYGFSKRWEFSEQGAKINVTCIITHKSGHSERTTFFGERDNSGGKNSIQQQASTVTYLQRYTLIGALGLATADEDNDGYTPDAGAPKEQVFQPESWLNENTPEWDEAESKLRSSEWTIDDVSKRWKVNKRQLPVLEAMYGKPKHKTGKPMLTKEHRAIVDAACMEFDSPEQIMAALRKDKMAIAYYNSLIKLSCGAVDLATVKNSYDLDEDTLQYFEFNAKK